MNSHLANNDTAKNIASKNTAIRESDRGQATILMAGVIAVALVLAVAIALVGQAMVHRVRARTAADAIALASTAGPSAEQELAHWYLSQGVVSERRGASVWAGSGPSQAAAWAGTTNEAVQTAPVLRAIVARVEQLRGQPFQTVTWGRSSFELATAEAQVMQSMSAEFSVCAISPLGSQGGSRTDAVAGRQRFEQC